MSDEAPAVGPGPDPGAQDLVQPAVRAPDPAPSEAPGLAGQAGEPAPGGPRPARAALAGNVIIQAIIEGSPAVITILAIFLALVIGGLLIAVSDPVVLRAWDSVGYAPGAAFSATWDSAASAYSAMFEGSIFNPGTIAAAFHGGSIAAIFYPLSLTVFEATPLILTGLAVGIAFRAGLFNIGATSQFIGGAMVAAWLGFAINMPIVIHVIVCIIGALIGGAIMGWLVGELKARTGAHEVIVTIMLNYIMEYLLSYLLSTPKALQQPGQYNEISPPVTPSAYLPHVGGPPPQASLGFLIAIAAAAGVAWLLTRSTIGFQFRTVGANQSAARSAGIRPERAWALVMLIAGGLAGLAAATIVLAGGTPPPPLNTSTYGTYGIDGITVALLGRARPFGIVLAALLFGALNAGGTSMAAATTVPADIVEVIEGLIVLFVAAPPLIRAVFRLRAAAGTGMEAAGKGWNG
ncbi:MAG TPA: ABC transporter permease [Streptosporangiaceae bacterium]|nr:ABC transporter permease [Streptosporangiaceae bacterium]